MAEANTEAIQLAGLTERQQRGLIDVLAEVRQADGWSWQLPVLLRERCWLKLSRAPLTELHRLLPPDGRDEAPELMQYRLLLQQGVDPLLAQQTKEHTGCTTDVRSDKSTLCRARVWDQSVRDSCRRFALDVQ